MTSQPETQSRIWVERSSVRSRFRWEGPLLVLVATVPDLSFVMPSLKALYTFSSTAYDQAHNILYAGAFVPSPPEGLGGPATKANTHSHGVWACSSPDTKPAWTNTGGEVSPEDIRNLVYDPVRGVLYAATERGAWRYATKVNQ